MNRIQELYPNLNCFHQTTNVERSHENPYFNIWGTQQRDRDVIDPSIEVRTKAMVEQFAGLAETILKPKKDEECASSNLSDRTTQIETQTESCHSTVIVDNRRVVDNRRYTHVQFGNTYKSREQIQQEEQNKRTFFYVITGAIGAFMMGFFAYLAGRDSSALADKAEQLNILKSDLAVWNKNKTHYTTSDRQIEFSNRVDNMAKCAEDILTRRRTNAIISVVTKVALAISGVILLLGAIFVSPYVLIGGALLAAATIAVIAFKGGFDRTEIYDKQDAEKIRGELNQLYPADEEQLQTTEQADDQETINIPDQTIVNIYPDIDVNVNPNYQVGTNNVTANPNYQPGTNIVNLYPDPTPENPDRNQSNLNSTGVQQSNISKYFFSQYR